MKGRIWVSRVVLPKPGETDVWEKLERAIEGLSDGEGGNGGKGNRGYTVPEVRDVEAEWTGYRAGATTASVELRCSEAEKYKEMMKEVESPTTILYFHGGAYYLSKFYIYLTSFQPSQ